MSPGATQPVETSQRVHNSLVSQIDQEVFKKYWNYAHGEVWVIGMDISLYPQAGPYNNHEPRAVRKLLLHRREINRLIGKTREKGLTLVPLALYFKDGLAKLQIGLARGKKQYDKREAIKNREADRDLRRRMMK